MREVLSDLSMTVPFVRGDDGRKTDSRVDNPSDDEHIQY